MSNSNEKISPRLSEAYENVRRAYLARSGAERKRYGAEVRRRLGARAYEHIVGEAHGAPSQRSDVDWSTFDQAWGLAPRPRAVRHENEGASCVFDALGTTKPRAQPTAASATRRDGSLVRARPTRHSNAADEPTRYSNAAAELDRRMGFT